MANRHRWRSNYEVSCLASGPCAPLSPTRWPYDDRRSSYFARQSSSPILPHSLPIQFRSLNATIELQFNNVLRVKTLSRNIKENTGRETPRRHRKASDRSHVGAASLLRLSQTQGLTTFVDLTRFGHLKRASFVRDIRHTPDAFALPFL
jgi:hypothetical protein